MDSQIFIPHTTNVNPLPPDTPVAYKLTEDDQVRQAGRADQLCWAELPGRQKVAAYVPLTEGMSLDNMFVVSAALHAAHDEAEAKPTTSENAMHAVALAIHSLRLVEAMQKRAIDEADDE